MNNFDPGYTVIAGQPRDTERPTDVGPITGGGVIVWFTAENLDELARLGQWEIPDLKNKAPVIAADWVVGHDPGQEYTFLRFGGYMHKNPRHEADRPTMIPA